MGSRCLQTQQFNHQNMAEGPGKKPNHQAAGKKKNKIQAYLQNVLRIFFVHYVGEAKGRCSGKT